MSHYPILMSERHRHRNRERAREWLVWGFGSRVVVWWFLWSVWARPDPDVLLGNSSRRLNSLNTKKKKKVSRCFKFCFKRGVSGPTSLCDFTRLVLSRHACKHGYQREKKKKLLPDVSVVYVWVKIAFLFTLNLHLSLGRKCIENVSGQQLRLGSSSSSLYVVTK